MVNRGVPKIWKRFAKGPPSARWHLEPCVLSACHPAPLLLCSSHCVHSRKYAPLLRSGSFHLCRPFGDKLDRRVRPHQQRASALRTSSTARQTYEHEARSSSPSSTRVQSRAGPSLLHGRSHGGEGESGFTSPRQAVAIVEATSQGGHPTTSEETRAGPAKEQVEARRSRACCCSVHPQ